MNIFTNYTNNFANFKNNLITIFIVVYIIIALFYQQALFNDILDNYQLLLIGWGVVIIIINILNSKYNFTYHEVSISYISILGSLLLGFVIINSIFIRFELLGGAMFSILVSIAIAKNINRTKTPFLLLIPFWFLFIYILQRLLINPNPNMVFINSKNYVSYYLIFMVVPYYYVKLNRYETPLILPAILTFILSAYSFGRSGIVASICILGSAVWTRIKLSRTRKVIYLVIFSGFIIVFYQYLFLKGELWSVERFTNLNTFLRFGGRAIIWSSYFSNFNISQLFFGLNVNKLLLSIDFTSHSHSSLILFHSAGGIASIVFLLYLFYKMKCLYQHNFSLFLLSLGIMIRISTDSGALFGYFDYVIWIFLYTGIVSNNIDRQHKNKIL